MTIEEASVERFPLSVGDRVSIRWASAAGKTYEGRITRLDTSTQWGREVVHNVMVKVDGIDNEQSVAASILTKIKQ